MYGKLRKQRIVLTDVHQTFKARAAVIADQAHNPRGALGEGADFMRGLDENERQRKWHLWLVIGIC
jgi:GINS complex subunit 3